MEFDFGRIAAELRYKLLVSFVGPRPIALVTTLSPEGRGRNAAPMSFFNVFAQSPPLPSSVSRTARACARTPRATSSRPASSWSTWSTPIARQMVICAVEFPPEVDEVRTAGTLRPSVTIGPAGSPRPRGVRVPAGAHGRVSRPLDRVRRGRLHARARRCIDPATLRVRPENYAPSPACTATITWWRNTGVLRVTTPGGAPSRRAMRQATGRRLPGPTLRSSPGSRAPPPARPGC